MIAALYVEKNGVYYGLSDVDPWDEERDANRYPGPYPVVAHPPCKVWSLMGQCRGYSPSEPDIVLFASALRSVREFGGVLEHPAHSKAWRWFNLPRPASEGWTSSLADPGVTCEVDQAWYGHPANKMTWLYYVGDPPPQLRWGRAPNTGRTVRNDGGGRSDQRSKTPPAFRDLLLELARFAARNRTGIGLPGYLKVGHGWEHYTWTERENLWQEIERLRERERELLRHNGELREDVENARDERRRAIAKRAVA